MPGRKDRATVPDGYQGREQAIVKLRLLESYLEKLFMIGMSSAKLGITEICYVDCFAGPWGDEREDLSGTSIAISLLLERSTLRKTRAHSRACGATFPSEHLRGLTPKRWKAISSRYGSRF